MKQPLPTRNAAGAGGPNVGRVRRKTFCDELAEMSKAVHELGRSLAADQPLAGLIRIMKRWPVAVVVTCTVIALVVIAVGMVLG